MTPELAQRRAALANGRQALIDQLLASRPTSQGTARHLREMTQLVDGALMALWQDSHLPETWALVAVGGYGRAELYAHSDVDVLILVPERPLEDSPAHAALTTFITACWDVGLEIGAAVRTPADCVSEAAQDATIQTTLLECRLLTGARKAYDTLRADHDAALDPKAFWRAKLLELHQRHTKYEDTPYALEPNCKESPGGLRDLQVLIWLARAAKLGRNWSEMAARDLVTPFEVRQLHRHEAVLKAIRARLHALAGRREDRLVFDLQTTVAQSFGLRAGKGERVSEALMRRYYWAAKAVTQLHQIVLTNLDERIHGTETAPMRTINGRFRDRGGKLEVARDDLYAQYPHAILETFLIYAQTPGITGLSARTLRALYNHRSVMNAAFRRDPMNHELFMDILRQPSGQTHALRLMNQTSVLGRYLWVFRRIVGRMQHDLFHVYTVDQHILMVVRNVRRFFMPEHAHEYPLCSQLAARWDKPWLMYLAALFHDVAKGRGGDHSQLGAVEVRRFARAHGIDGEDAALLEFLVRHHLTLSTVAQKQDLSDPDVIQAFAQLVGNERQLTALYLLTVADVRGTSPKVWNAWKAKLLEDLYRLTLRALGGDAPGTRAEQVDARRTEARRQLSLRAVPAGAETALWASAHLSYFARHEAADLAWHVRALHEHLHGHEPVVRARPSPVGEGLQVVVYTPDQPDLFARICGYFDGVDFSIVDAKIHTTRDGYALDTFQLVHPDARAGQLSAYRDLIALVESQLATALRSTAPLPLPRSGRLSRRVRFFPAKPEVTLQPDERGEHSVLEVTATDRAGLLYGIARVLARHKLSLHLAKISTLGERVEDTFLISGEALQRPREQLQLESDLLDALAPEAAQ